MATLNQVQLIGYVGDEPKPITTKSGKSMSSLTLATTDREIKRPDGSIIPERTEWHNIVTFGHNADFVTKFVHKGAQLYVQGALRTRKYEKPDKTTGYITEIIADNVQLLDRKPNNNAPASQQPAYQQPQYEDMAQRFAAPPANIEDDDMPF